MPTAQEFFHGLLADSGVDADTINKIASNPKAAARVADYVQRKEYEDIERRAADLEMAYNGTTAKPGSKAYQQWYEENYDKIVQAQNAAAELQSRVARYEERYGKIDDATTKPAAIPTPAAGATALDEKTLISAIDKHIQTNYAPQWSQLIRGGGKIVEKHVRAGRKTEIDWDVVSANAAKHGGNLVAGYDEWDAPEAQKSAKEAEDARVQKRVDEELKKRMKEQTANFFPAGADGSTATTGGGGIGRRTDSDKKYDRNKVIESAVTGEYVRPN
jgi:hypothetical protein